MKELKELHCYGQKYVTLEKKTKAILLLAAFFCGDPCLENPMGGGSW